MAHTQKDL